MAAYWCEMKMMQCDETEESYITSLLCASSSSWGKSSTVIFKTSRIGTSHIGYDISSTQ